MKEGINIEKHRFFSGRSKDFLIDFVPFLEITTYEKDDIVGCIGNACEEIFLVLTGELVVLSDEGMEILEIPKNDFIGARYSNDNFIFDIKVKKTGKIIILKKFDQETLNVCNSKDIGQILGNCDSKYKYLVESSNFLNYILDSFGPDNVKEVVENFNYKYSKKKEKFTKALKNLILNYPRDKLLIDLNNFHRPNLEEDFDFYKKFDKLYDKFFQEGDEDNSN
jgi:hypothetical protein